MPKNHEELYPVHNTFVDNVIVPGLRRCKIGNHAIEDPMIINAFRRVDRGLFAPIEASIYQIYGDEIISLQDGSTISQPSLVAVMMHGLQLNGSGKVLEVGTASGYSAALLSQCAEEVHTIEYDEELAEQARIRLARFGYDNVTVYSGDGLLGVPIAAPFDRIIVTAALRYIPRLLVEQLKDGGIIIAPVAYMDTRTQDIIQGIKRGDRLQKKQFMNDVAFVLAVSSLRGGWTQETYERAEKRRDERSSALKSPRQPLIMIDPENEENSPEALAKVEQMMYQMSQLSPIARQIEERIGILMDLGLTYDQMQEDSELLKLQAAARNKQGIT